jgi:hypothetical protein
MNKYQKSVQVIDHIAYWISEGEPCQDNRYNEGITFTSNAMIDYATFQHYVRHCASADTSVDPDGWSLDCPLWGHCAVVSLLAQDYFGGRIIRVSLENVPRYASIRSHYINDFPDGSIDFTAEQFPNLSMATLPRTERSREMILAHPDTLRRYLLLQSRFTAMLHS